MALRNFFGETPQHMQHVCQGLPQSRLGKEDHEINRMALARRHSDFRVALEAADPRAMAGAWIDNNDRRFVRIDAVVPAMPVDFRDAQQCIVDGPFEAARVQQRFILEVQKRRQSGSLVLQHVVRALAKRVPEQNGAFEEVALVIEIVLRRRCFSCSFHATRRILWRRLQQLLGMIQDGRW